MTKPLPSRAARAHRLLALAERCDREDPSRELDGAICCVLHDVVDINKLDNDYLRAARAAGEIVIESHGQFVLAWLVAPRFTSEIEAARTLAPGHNDAAAPTDPMKACTAALRDRAALAVIGAEELPAPMGTGDLLLPDVEIIFEEQDRDPED